MSKNKHTFAKRQREIEKKRKSDEKRAKRRDKTRNTDAPEEESVDGEEGGALEADPVRDGE